VQEVFATSLVCRVLNSCSKGRGVVWYSAKKKFGHRHAGPRIGPAPPHHTAASSTSHSLASSESGATAERATLSASQPASQPGRRLPGYLLELLRRRG
jgi:hypothetical protein